MTADSHAITARAIDEDALLGAFLDLERAYDHARRESEVVDAFLGRAGTLVPGVQLSVRVRDPIDGTIRLYGVVDVPEERRRRVDARALSGDLDLGGFAAVDGFESDFASAPHGADLAFAKGGRLFVVVSAATQDARDLGAQQTARLRRLGEQLVDALASVAERSETARLRLYAGSIVDRTNVPIAVVDAHGRVRLSNGALRSAIGAPEAELDAATLLDAVEASGRVRIAMAHARAMRGRATSGVEITVGERNGAGHQLLVDFEPILLPNGEVDAALVVARDVTRVRELEDQVSHADRLATLGQLAAGVVHELNNPLTSILVYTEYVLRRAEARGADDGEVDKLRRVLDAASRIQEFAKDLVTYARAERGHREPLALGQVLDQAVAFCAPIVERGHVLVTRDYANELPEVPAVRGQLHQVFINLLTNAVHAVSPKGGRVHLSLSAPLPGWVEVRIEDDGPGVPEDRREAIFQPFVTSKPSGHGTGLGLSIVRNLVERHAGTIEVEASLLGGAAFVLRLPTKPTSERPPPTEWFAAE